MPQVDLETLVTACAGGGPCDSKVACETAADPRGLDNDSERDEDGAEIPPPPDYAPESFWLSKDAEFDWFDRNAYYERRDSINSHSTSLNPNVHPHSNSSSQRFPAANLKSKASIIGLPKTQKTAFAEAKNWKNGKPGNMRLFPNRAGLTASKTDQPVIEPGSPKVSCMGRVRSKRKDRSRRMRNRSRQTEPVRPPPSKERSGGLFESFKAMFRARRRRRRSGRKDDDVDVLAAPSEEKSVKVIVRDIRERLPAPEADALRNDSVGGGARRRSVGERDGDAPSLGGMKRFASGRKSDSWAGDVA